MLDIKFIRDNKDLITLSASKKHVSFNVDELLTIDDERKGLIAEIDEIRASQNKVNVIMTSSTDENEKNKIIAEMRALKESLQQKEEKLRDVMKKWQTLMLAVPNIPDISVPDGDSDENNVEVKKWGDVPQFSFAPKNHIELMTSKGMIDLERGTKVSGFRGYFLKGDGALLSFAIWQFLVNEFTRLNNFTPMIVPSLVKKEVLYGSGYLPQGEDDLYRTQDDDYLTGTGEVATMGYYMDEVVEAKDLPIKYFAFSPCFRREAGSHGKDTKGIFRVHEFYKFEQVILCEASHETSVKLHEELLANSERVMQKLGLPYHVVLNCGGDLGLGQVKKYDIEAWVPSEGKYRETHSCSYFHDFQTRRLNIRYRDGEGKLRFVHSLNNTALAIPRVLVSIVENNQQPDGSIKIPDALVPFMGKNII